MENMDIEKVLESLIDKTQHEEVVIIKIVNILRDEQLTHEEGLTILSKTSSVLKKASLRKKI